MSDFRPRRSALFLPASNARAIEKVRGLAADVVILDLEDAVSPDAKVDARAAAVAAAGEGFGARETVIRVNSLDTDWGADDLSAAGSSGADAVLVPKVRNAADVARYREAIGDKPLWLMIETCEALGRLQDIAEAGAAAFVLGVNDLALELGARRGADRGWLSPVQAMVLGAARSRGLVALDGVCNDFSDDVRLRAECEAAAAMGYDGKSLIHPRQIEVCNAAFSPSADELAWAIKVRDAFATSDRGVVQVEGKMVEALHLAQAERILRMAGE
ncbi:CoA ester lyase [Sphingomonas sp.]|jgi:citrate lyase subunit beta/citryl-CoA lyase|uniref:HpcH/HpaI aldolase/citrate lyase family protein n=1 Tax=Sphingomonas sp. TaxID=28214 RepID=UPI002E37D4D3|nr:CoA ester lyase [Sphingomonas sp.]HEX4693183.1 CoA ester lyase [Sphingomonas sp.]